MSFSSPYVRTFLAGAIWFGLVAIKMVSRHSGHWSTYPPRNLITLLVAWIVTALLLGVVATRFQKMRSWWGIGLGTVAGSFVTLALMLFIVTNQSPTPALKEFKTTDEMMEFFAMEATKWVKQDQGIELDYSLDSVKRIEEQLARISSEVNKTNPPPGTFGMASGYGAYIGEVFRRRDGGSWGVDHPIAGARSYPFTTKSNSVIFPVGWCWKRIINGEEDNVYLKAKMFSQLGDGSTNLTEAILDSDAKAPQK